MNAYTSIGNVSILTQTTTPNNIFMPQPSKGMLSLNDKHELLETLKSLYHRQQIQRPHAQNSLAKFNLNDTIKKC